ncbi:hypothetical protein QWE_16848 [Agrobacterium albertimagni AOL15]|uniref:Uncharacterized protein n=1 Tax=Agrobacterium albertimagni AOL15 TaxID=1156935 RepID=K2PZX2_9HYPH|nr:hypothetical protein [Agrobacterium albertimagni]EKF58290.1 hypothetical protein QWE_16848 [Agrobacterium albertimagni AOL15]
MNYRNVRNGLFAIAIAAANGMTAIVAKADEFSFKATNTTSSAITGILVSENKSTWGAFDIGSGIKPGSTAELVWDQSTNSESCAQWVKATFADGSESEAAQFDFCENGLDLEC